MTELALALEQRLAGASMPETLARLAGDDPRLAQLAQVLALQEQQERERRAAEELDASAEDAVGTEGLAHLQEELSRLREELGRVHGLEERLRHAAATQRRVDEIAQDRARLLGTVERVAAALGACPVCLGDDEDCALCHGRGAPGSLPPVPEDFRRVVLPAVQAHAYTRSRSRRARPTPIGTPTPIRTEE